jgi:hypothetical protein
VSDKIIVLVGDRGDSNHGEISIMDDPRKAEKLVETLLEAGFEQERIHLFAGRESDFQVSRRPVVALVGEDEDDEPQVGATAQEAAVPVQEAAPPKPAPDAEEAEIDSRGGQESETEEEIPATVDAAAPVKFSSLFRSA